jgi:hypothetical protein
LNKADFDDFVEERYAGVGNSDGNTTKRFEKNSGKYWFYVHDIIRHELKK